MGIRALFFSDAIQIFLLAGALLIAEIRAPMLP